MTTSITVSVVIPTRGLHRRDRLLRCIESVHRSIAPDASIEIIVVLDGERPDDYALLDSADQPATVIAQAPRGPAAARNQGWRAATGDVIAFLDDDTVVLPTWHDDIVRFYAEHPDLAAAGGRVWPIEPKNMVSRMMTDLGHLNHQATRFGLLLVTANASVRRAALAELGGFDERFVTAAGEDSDLCIRLTAAGHTIGLIDGADAYHHHPTSTAAMIATAARYRDAYKTPIDEGQLARVRSVLGGMTRRLPLSKGLRARWERATFELPGLRRAPAIFAEARRGPTRPSVRTALVETWLEVVWRAESARSPVS